MLAVLAGENEQNGARAAHVQLPWTPSHPRTVRKREAGMTTARGGRPGREPDPGGAPT